MDPIVIAVDPVVATVGGATIHWYGLSISLALAAALPIALREARRRSINNDTVYVSALIGTIGGVIGARLFHVVEYVDFYLQNPAAVMVLGQGGLTVMGGLLVGGGLVTLYCWIVGAPVAPVADAAAPALLLAQTIGRIGSLAVGDAYGIASELPWAVMYVHRGALIPDLGLPVHPYPLYEMLWNAVALGFIWRLRRQTFRGGTLFLAYLLAYATGRLVLGLLRPEPSILFGLSLSQMLALVLIVPLVPILAKRARAEAT